MSSRVARALCAILAANSLSIGAAAHADDAVGVPAAEGPDGATVAPRASAEATGEPRPPRRAEDEPPASFGGVFLGTAAATDPYLREGGKLSVGAATLLRVEDSRWIAGFSAAIMGGSRFQRVVTPFIPKLAGTQGFDAVQGIGNVASIYTDVMHIPIASYAGYGWRVGPVDLLVAAGPSAHRLSVSRFEQITGVASKPPAIDEDAQAALSTYTVDRRFVGNSKRWGAGAAALAAALVDVGSMPFVAGRWSIGAVGTASSAIGRQGCGALDRDDVKFGSVCVPLEYELVSRTYYTEGKEQFDDGIRDTGKLVLPMQAMSFSVNAALFFQF